LPLDFTPKAQQEPKPVIENASRLDVNDLAPGMGFTTTVRCSIALHDALQPLQNEIDSDYDQRLCDLLWMAHFKLSLGQSQCATFHFTFARKDSKIKEVYEASLRVRVELRKQIVLLGFLEDFQEWKHRI
jgi:hypothetical protein